MDKTGLPHVDKIKGWKRAGYVKKSVCDRCGSVEKLCVHHKDRNPYNNSDFSNLETLCRPCHVKEHWSEIIQARSTPEVVAKKIATLRVGFNDAKLKQRLAKGLVERHKNTFSARSRALMTLGKSNVDILEILSADFDITPAMKTLIHTVRYRYRRSLGHKEVA